MTDVLIIGAGPAGAVSAALLAQKGYEVLVLEKQHFPRFSIGESLLANSMQILEEAGMGEAVMAKGFQFKNGAAFVWGDEYAAYNFAEKVTEGSRFTYQVPRGEFDQLLATEAARMGATIRFGVEITAIDCSGQSPVVTSVSESGETTTHRPRFVFDASGFGRTLPRLLHLEKPSAFPVRTALFCHIRDGIPSGAFDRQKIRAGINPTHRDVWSWLIPFSNGIASLGVVGTPEHHAKYAGTREERLWAMVADEPKLKQLLSNAKLAREVGELVGYSASVTSLHGPGFALLGNAGEFIDPIFSSGVTIALQSAKLACDALDRQLRGEAIDWQADYQEPLMFGVETFRAFVTGWYDLSFQDIIFAPRGNERIYRCICSVLAGYVWDGSNPYNGPKASQRLSALARTIRNERARQTAAATN